MNSRTRLPELLIIALASICMLTLWQTPEAVPRRLRPGARNESLATATPTVTVTPTSHPGPPTLIAPPGGAVLPQPVPPDAWTFVWAARGGPCWSSIDMHGPDHADLHADIHTYDGNGYHYTYSQTNPFPASAFGPWSWQTHIWCPLGSNVSDTYIFWLGSTPTNFYLPIILRNQ
jgi:hypothetical protein